ncbi:MAG: hypothetical protein HY040_04655 [Planctomycetes bacterium]|nr:hypothetical protein [Planctomycetota bacterium]
MARFISAAVGAGGVNLREDVRVIQEMLNQVPDGEGGPSPLLDTDSVVGPLTIGAIRNFQKRQVGFNDGRVDTNNVTINKLNTFDRTPASSAAVSFRHQQPLDPLNPLNQADPLDGFDATAAPFPWLLVPFQDVNRVRLVNGGSFSLLTSNRNIATVERDIILGTIGRIPTGIINIQGVAAGDAFIRVLDGAGNQVARLDVSVRRRRNLGIAFHYVVNAGVGTQTRNPGDEAGFLPLMNQIYLRQANIQFRLVSARRLTITDNLGTEVNTIGLQTNGEWPNIVRHRNGSAKFNVFFVREVETDDDGEPGGANFSATPTDSVDAITEIGGNRDCIFEDAAGNAANMGETLAHEAGHALGELDDGANPLHLMFGTTDARGRKITKAQALRMHQNAGL